MTNLDEKVVAWDLYGGIYNFRLGCFKHEYLGRANVMTKTDDETAGEAFADECHKRDFYSWDTATYDGNPCPHCMHYAPTVFAAGVAHGRKAERERILTLAEEISNSNSEECSKHPWAQRLSCSDLVELLKQKLAEQK